MKKKLIAGMICACMMSSMLAGCGDQTTAQTAAGASSAEGSSAAASTEAASAAATETSAAASTEAAVETTMIGDGKDAAKTINLWAFTDEVPNMIKKYKELHPDFDYDVKCTIIATTDGAYQPALDQALAAGGDSAPDMYCAESAFVLKYTQGDASQYAAAYDDLGIDTAKEIKDADIAQYSVDIGTNGDGKVVGLGYQATGGAFIYRRSIAKDVWGTDDPATI